MQHEVKSIEFYQGQRLTGLVGLLDLSYFVGRPGAQNLDKDTIISSGALLESELWDTFCLNIIHERYPHEYSSFSTSYYIDTRDSSTL